jgi:hypothetical protein
VKLWSQLTSHIETNGRCLFCIIQFIFSSLKARYTLPVSRQICCLRKTVLKWYIRWTWKPSANRFSRVQTSTAIYTQHFPYHKRFTAPARAAGAKRCILKVTRRALLRCSHINNENQWSGNGYVSSLQIYLRTSRRSNIFLPPSSECRILYTKSSVHKTYCTRPVCESECDKVKINAVNREARRAQVQLMASRLFISSAPAPDSIIACSARVSTCCRFLLPSCV